MQGLKSTLINTLITATLLSASVAVHAEGMVPETSLLIIDEATHSGTINVKNTDSHCSSADYHHWFRPPRLAAYSGG